MIRKVQVLDCPEVGLPLVLKMVFSELTESFQRDRSIQVQWITRIDQIDPVPTTMIFLGDSFHQPMITLPPEPLYVGWYWHNRANLPPRFIHTGENREWHSALHKNRTSFVPLLLRANEAPSTISSYQRFPIRDYCYMGWGYLPDWEPFPEYKGLYHGVYDHSKFLDYPARRAIYLTSVFALGFQSPENVSHEHVSQRIFEGMAYGCIVLTNSPAAAIQTDLIAVLVTSRAELVAQMKYYLDHPDALKAKQLKGYQFIREKGTNFHATELYVNYAKLNFQDPSLPTERLG